MNAIVVPLRKGIKILLLADEDIDFVIILGASNLQQMALWEQAFCSFVGIFLFLFIEVDNDWLSRLNTNPLVI